MPKESNSHPSKLRRSKVGHGTNASADELAKGKRSLRSLRKAADDCRACDLWERATQTVFGAGPRTAVVMFVGEQPGNEEDLSGKPFVGPAGRLLEQALADADIDKAQAYITNVVKHFRWEPRGKRRIHKRPNSTEIAACRPWLESEIAVVKPQAIMLLGATAAQALFGSGFRVTVMRGRVLESRFAPIVMATIHPSAILRAPDEDTRRKEYRDFVDDLKKLATAVSRSPERV